MARPGVARHGRARPGRARHGWAWQGKARKLAFFKKAFF